MIDVDHDLPQGYAKDPPQIVPFPAQARTGYIAILQNNPLFWETFFEELMIRPVRGGLADQRCLVNNCTPFYLIN